MDRDPGLYADPGLDIAGIDGAIPLFGYYLGQSRPALQLLYGVAAIGGEHQWAFAITPAGTSDLDAMETLSQEMQKSEAAAASFFLTLDVLVDSLVSGVYEIQNGKPRKKRVFIDIELADVLQAAGNFVRHSAEWGRQASGPRDLSLVTHGARSARILGSALDGGCDDRAIVQSLLNTANPMFRLLHRMFGKHSRTPQHPEFEAYPVVEARIRKLAEQIVNAIRP